MNSAKQTQTEAAREENYNVSAQDLQRINAAGGIAGQYVIYGPGTPSYDPRTDGEVN